MCENYTATVAPVSTHHKPTIRTEHELTTATITRMNIIEETMSTLCDTSLTEHSFILSLLSMSVFTGLTTVALVTVIIGWIITCVYYQQKMKTQ